MSDILETLKEICTSILPMLGVITLILVIILLIKLIGTVKSANIALKKGSGTIDLVDESIKKVQVPLDTAVKVSETIDKAHDATIKGIEEAKQYVSKNASEIKKKLNKIVNSTKTEETKKIQEPIVNDVL